MSRIVKVAAQEWRWYLGEVTSLPRSLRSFGMNRIGITIFYLPMLLSMVVAGVVLLVPTILFKSCCLTS